MPAIFDETSAKATRELVELESKKKKFIKNPIWPDVNMIDLYMLENYYEEFFEEIHVQFEDQHFEYTLILKKKKHTDNKSYFLQLKLVPMNKSKWGSRASIKKISNYIIKRYSIIEHSKKDHIFVTGRTGNDKNIKFDVKSIVKKYKNAKVILVKFKNPPDGLCIEAARKIK